VKKCPKCGETKPLDEYNKRRAAPDGHQSVCRACQRAAMAERRADPVSVARDQARQKKARRTAEHRARDAARKREGRAAGTAYAERQRDAIRKRMRSNRERLDAVKMTRVCVDCGWGPADLSEVRRLHFDHIDPATKHLTPPSMKAAFSLAWSWQRIEAELRKCAPRCAACHGERTSRQRRQGAGLTDVRWRDGEILKLRAEGLSQKAISEQVGCSPATVSNVLRRHLSAAP
jgi:DNA-binding CsgD family transcriptional regulator